MTTSHWARPHSFRMPDAPTDVLILGGGFVGLATAYWLTEYRPHLRITILEKSFCGAGASGRNAGFITAGSASFYKGLALKWGSHRALEIYRFATESLELTQEHLLRSSSEIKHEGVTSKTLFQSEDQFRSWTSAAFTPEEFGFTWQSSEFLPENLGTKFYGAYGGGKEYKVNPVQLLGSLRALLESRKVRIIETSSAYEITPEGVRTELSTIQAKQVVIALNGYAGQFHPAFKEHIIPKRAQMLAVEPEVPVKWPDLYYDPAERVYWRTHGKTLMIGGKRLLDEEGENSDFEKVSSLIQKGLENYLTHQLGIRYQVIGRWSGIMGFTDHELPLVSRVKAPLEAYVIAGFSGHGMGLGFKSAQGLAELVIGKNQESFFQQFKKADFKL